MVAASGPVLYGVVSFDGTPVGPPPVGAHVVWASPAAALYAEGSVCDLRIWGDAAGVFALWGESAPADAPGDLRDVEGSFVAFRIADDVECSTDRFGFRRLLYWDRGNALLFATHLSGLERLAGKLPGSDERALLHYYNFGFTPNDRTLLDGVRKVPPASTLRVRGGAVTVETYDTLARLYRPDRFANATEAEICREIDTALLRSVERRTRGRGQVGVALSGGVDSGFVAQKAVESGAPVIGYTLAYGTEYNEFERVDHLASALRIPVRKITLAPDEVLDNYEGANRLASEPVAFNNATMRFVGLAARRDGISSLLDGDGTDRLFLGQSRHLQYARMVRAYAWLERAHLLPVAAPALRSWGGGDLRKVGHHFENWRRGIPPYAERGLGRLQASYDESYERRIYDLSAARHHATMEREIGSDDFGLSLTYLGIRMCPELFFNDVGEVQRELGLRSVPAFWDDDLVSIAISLPTAWKLRKGQTKYILRRAAALNMDAGYWMLPKIGLQSAFRFAVGAPEGRAWHQRRLEQAREMDEARVLEGIVPGGIVQPERLLGLLVWKEAWGLCGA